MPLPLIWAGVGLGACVAGYHLSRPAKTKAGLALKPRDIPDGAVVYCGIYGMFEHSGIWVEGSVIERHGCGLIKAVAPRRFIDKRSGSTIRVACDSQGNPLACEQIAAQAVQRIFEYDDYHLLARNCHHFVSQCLGHPDKVILFGELTTVLHDYFDSEVRWREIVLD
ncbi:hypothetical protein HMF8227_01576 [Saliniradius amylolyticus]|uniref:LRAT domain-containing protein n=1 Tax=Saliniradius amylolyticus TaxID=2183582 RepID=A0A2S2E478_9ALTE|nr:lecithin retinol acyltransferase family protein [Saliniradius amylolyticus]AWL12050.1 hypothetical protein HMF8227_01576 [Saliniradius amylolyticus]